MFSLLIIFGVAAAILKVAEEYAIDYLIWREVQTAFTILFLIQAAVLLLCYVNKEE